MSYTCTFYAEDDVLQLGDSAIEVEVYYTVDLGCGPSWSEWSGGDPGYPASIEVDGWNVAKIRSNTDIDFNQLDENKKNEVACWIETMIEKQGIRQIEQYESDMYDGY